MMRSMFAAISGLKAHQVMLDVAASDIANVNTVGYKGERTSFKEALSQLQKGSTGSGTNLGGTNAAQVGLGVQLNSIDNQMTAGAIQSTGNPFDLAIQGDGWFQVTDDPTGFSRSYYTRAGNFTRDVNGDLVTPGGLLRRRQDGRRRQHEDHDPADDRLRQRRPERRRHDHAPAASRPPSRRSRSRSSRTTRASSGQRATASSPRPTPARRPSAPPGRDRPRPDHPGRDRDVERRPRPGVHEHDHRAARLPGEQPGHLGRRRDAPGAREPQALVASEVGAGRPRAPRSLPRRPIRDPRPSPDPSRAPALAQPRSHPADRPDARHRDPAHQRDTAPRATRMPAQILELVREWRAAVVALASLPDVLGDAPAQLKSVPTGRLHDGRRAPPGHGGPRHDPKERSEMKQTTAVGIGGAFVMLLLGVIMEGGNPMSFINIPAFIIVIGGTCCAAARLGQHAGGGVHPQARDPRIYGRHLGRPAGSARQMVGLAEKARREGLLALEAQLEEVDDEFTKKGVSLIVDGTDSTSSRRSCAPRSTAWRSPRENAKLFATAGRLRADARHPRHRPQPCPRAREPVEPGRARALDRRRVHRHALRRRLGQHRLSPRSATASRACPRSR